jgi:hypothetical protein
MRFGSYVLCLVFILSACAVRSGEKGANRRAEALAVERGRLTETADPVARTKSYIKISEILLEFIGDSVRLGDMESFRQLVGQFVTNVNSARDAMVNSGRNAAEKAAGFRELEISLRRQSSQLQEISRVLSFDQREGLEPAIRVTESVRQEILKLLFPNSSE